MPLESRPRRSEVAIRPATTEDRDFILSLVPRLVACGLPRDRRKRDLLKAIRNDIARGLREAPAGEAFFVSEGADGTHTGFLRLQVQRDFFSGARACHVSDVVVMPEHEGEGIGRALLRYARRWARAHRCRLLTLNVLPANARARALYERAGFAPDVLRMARLLPR